MVSCIPIAEKDMLFDSAEDEQQVSFEWDTETDNNSESEDSSEANVPTHSIRNQEDHYGLRYSGNILIEQTGMHTFYLGYDDDSRLFVNDVLLIDNDGLHGTFEMTHTLILSEGKHSFQVDYFEAEGGQFLDVQFEGPDIEKQVIPVRLFSH